MAQLPPRIGRLLWVLRLLVMVLIPALPLLVAVWTWQGARAPGWLDGAWPMLPAGTVLTGAKSTAVLALGALSLGPMIWILWQMRGLFGLYAVGAALSEAAARHIRRAGAGLAALALMQALLRPMQTLVLTFDNGPGGRSVTVAITSEMLWLALSGGLLVVIGWAMSEAARQAEENRGFV